MSERPTPPTAEELMAARREAVAVLVAAWDPDFAGPRVDLACGMVRTSEVDSKLLTAMLVNVMALLMEELEAVGGDGTVSAWLQLLGASVVFGGGS